METQTTTTPEPVKPSRWDRDQLTLRLSPSRRIQLRALAEEGQELTPQQAVDRAIAVAHEAKRLDVVAVAVDGRLAQWAAPPLLSDWLRPELARQGAESARSAVVRATWERSVKLQTGSIAHDFGCRLLAVDGRRLANEGPFTVGQARLGPIPAGTLGILVESGADACLWCEPSSNGGLRVMVHAFAPDGSVGGALSEHHF